jgi:hypothetical protein
MSRIESICSNAQGAGWAGSTAVSDEGTVLAGVLREICLVGFCLAAVFAGLLTVSTAFAAPAETCSSAMISRQHIRAATDDIMRLLRSAHYGSADGIPAAMATKLEDLRHAPRSKMPAWKFASDVNIALATANDGHLGLHLIAEAETHCPRLPLELAWSDSGLFVRQGGPVPAGSRVISIGGQALATLQQIALTTVPHENVYWARNELARQLPRADMALSYGLVAADGNVTVVFKRPDGTSGAQRMFPTIPAPPPGEAISYQIFPERSTALLRLSHLDNNDESAAKLAQFFGGVIHDHIQKVVVDLRGNPGGDASLAVAILRYLGHTNYESFSVDIHLSRELHEEQPRFDPENIGPAFVAAGLKPPSAGARGYWVPGPLVLAATTQTLPAAPREVAAGRQLFLMVDGGTFSSAALFALLVRDNHLGVLIGEPVGTSTSFHGGELDIRVAPVDYFLSISTTRLDRPDVSAGISPTILPDVFIPLSGSSLAAAKDDALDYVLRAATNESP